jgi:hypothetical protein
MIIFFSQIFLYSYLINYQSSFGYSYNYLLYIIIYYSIKNKIVHIYILKKNVLQIYLYNINIYFGLGLDSFWIRFYNIYILFIIYPVR